MYAQYRPSAISMCLLVLGHISTTVATGLVETDKAKIASMLLEEQQKFRQLQGFRFGEDHRRLIKDTCIKSHEGDVVSVVCSGLNEIATCTKSSDPQSCDCTYTIGSLAGIGECASCSHCDGNTSLDCSNVDPGYNENICSNEGEFSITCDDATSCCVYEILFEGQPTELSCCDSSQDDTFSSECCATVDGKQHCSQSSFACSGETDCFCAISYEGTECSSCSYCDNHGVIFDCTNALDGWSNEACIPAQVSAPGGGTSPAGGGNLFPYLTGTPERSTEGGVAVEGDQRKSSAYKSIFRNSKVLATTGIGLAAMLV